MYSDKTKLTAGDFVIKNDDSYFLKYNKKLRGGDFETRFSVQEEKINGSNQLMASGAVSRGKFARNIFNGLEGNQGPYRLQGNENESFIIILSGTEAVYIDGKKLKRGQENDYVIDYNNAEVTFTANQPITKDKRIVVEFQYSSQSYSRSLVRFSDRLEYGKFKLRLDLYSEQDSKNRSLQQDLSDEQKEILEGIGNNVDQAFAPGVSVVEFENDRVLYKRVYDTIGTVVDSHYVYSTNPDSAFYQLSFSDVGIGNGNYIQIQSGANGKVYEYIAPIASVKQGNYEPIVLLVTPKKRQMFSIGGVYKVSDNSSLEFDFAFSNHDLNTFSEIDNSANGGTGVMVDWKGNKKLGAQEQWRLDTKIGVEHISKNFQYIERFRSVEFERDWNLVGLKLSDDQMLSNIGLGLSKQDKIRADYSFSSYSAGDDYSAYNNGLKLSSKLESIEWTYTGSMLNSETRTDNTQFYRHTTDFIKRAKYFEVGVGDLYEQNQFKDAVSDSLKNTSYEFWEWKAFLQNPSIQKNRLKLSYNNRMDKIGSNNRLKDITHGESVQLDLAWLSNKTIQVKSKSTYRKLDVKDSTLYSEDPEENVTSRIEYSLRLLKGAITTNSFYEVGSGLEEKKEFVYVEVGAGQGQYIWIDVNGNNVKELSEFQPKKFANDGDYIKVSTQTNEFIKTFSNQFSQSVFIQPGRVWKNASGFKRILARFSNQSAFKIDRRTESKTERFNPFFTNIDDSTLISINSSLRNVLYFNRSHPKIGMEWMYQQVDNKFETFNGTESRDNQFNSIGLRYTITSSYVANVKYTLGDKSNAHDLFEENNYKINYYEVVPKLTFQNSSTWKLSGLFGFAEKRNGSREGAELSETSRIELELQLNKVGKGLVRFSISLLDVSYNGLPNTSLSYEMLDGLTVGKNGIMDVNFQRNLGKNLQLNLNYNGRIGESSDIIHSGSVQMRAFF